MGMLIWIIFGALVGWVASMIMNGDGGLVWDIIVGIVGAVIGGFIIEHDRKKRSKRFQPLQFYRRPPWRVHPRRHRQSRSIIRRDVIYFHQGGRRRRRGKNIAPRIRAMNQ